MRSLNFSFFAVLIVVAIVEGYPRTGMYVKEETGNAENLLESDVYRSIAEQLKNPYDVEYMQRLMLLMSQMEVEEAKHPNPENTETPPNKEKDFSKSIPSEEILDVGNARTREDMADKSHNWVDNRIPFVQRVRRHGDKQ